MPTDPILPPDPILPRPYFDGKVTTLHGRCWLDSGGFGSFHVLSITDVELRF